MRKKILAMLGIAAVACVCRSQEAPAPKPQVKVNVLNVCTPSPAEQQEISSALARIPKRPSFTPDFEVDRGRSTLDPNANPIPGMAPANTTTVTPSDQALAEFVRIRRDFPNGETFSNVQYSFSRDKEQMVETLVFRLREAKDLLEISIESSASSVTSAATMLNAATPAGRIKLERFGKSSVVLARCSGSNGGPAPDQNAYEHLFASASSILSDYRGVLEARKLIPAELTRLSEAGVAHHKSASTGHHP